MNEKQVEIVRTMREPMGGDDRLQMDYEVLDDQGRDRKDEYLMACPPTEIEDVKEYIADALKDGAAPEWRSALKEAMRLMDEWHEVSVMADTIDAEIVGRTFADGYEYMLVRR